MPGPPPNNEALIQYFQEVSGLKPGIWICGPRDEAIAIGEGEIPPIGEGSSLIAPQNRCGILLGNGDRPTPSDKQEDKHRSLFEHKHH